MKKLTVLSLGGSLINPQSEPNAAYIKQFRQLIAAEVKKGGRFIVVIGGGGPARTYQSALKQLGGTKDQLDWVGVQATWLNAKLVQLAFGKLAESTVVQDPSGSITFKKSVLVAGGWKPGWSTDYDAVYLAKRFGADRVINLSNIDYVYTKDPRKFADAKKIENISWADFLKITGTKWVPGKNVPFDPVAAVLAKKSGLTVAVCNGQDLVNVRSLVQGKVSKGTIVS
jgi:uridylate kinase